MTSAPPLSILCDAERLAALQRTGLLDSGPEASYDRIGELARRVISVPIALVSLVDAERQYFKCALGLPEPWASARQTPLSHSICQHALEDTEPLLIADTRRDPRLDGNLASEALGALAYLGVPLASRDGHILGTFCVIDIEPREWTDDEVRTMTDLAAAVRAEIALREALTDLAAQAEREVARRSRAEALFGLAEALAAASGVAEIAGRVAELGAGAVGAAFANVALVDADSGELELRHAASLSPEIGDRWPRVPLDGRTPLGEAVRTGAPILLSGVEEIRSRFPDGAADSELAGFAALAAVPVRDRSAALGFAWREPIAFGGTHRRILGTVSDLVGQALERARLYERERALARDLQRNLLPKRLDAVPGADVAARYEAGADALEVGGDWFDIGELADGRHVLAVGDIVGHGVDAAAAMGQLRAAFTAMATNASDLDALVERVDRYAAATDSLRFSTAVVAEFCAADGALTVFSAGHVPVLIRRADGRIEVLDGGGPPLGFDPSLSRTPVRTRLDPGDVVALYTDGLIERRGEQIDLGIARLEAALAAASTTSAEAVCDEVFGELGSQDDDAALLVLVVDDVECDGSGDDAVTPSG